MKNIRNGVFETNSSSVHSIAISKKKLPDSKIPSTVFFEIGEYGWENDVVSDTASYLYSGATETQMETIKNILEESGIKCEFETRRNQWDGYVDHEEDLIEFVDSLIRDKDKLFRFLFGDSVIYTGNDNSCEEDAMCYSGERTLVRFDEAKQDWVSYPNPNHDSKNYEYYVRGN